MIRTHAAQSSRAMPRLLTPFSIEARADNAADGEFAGWASTDSLDSWGTIIAPGAFDESIANHKRAGTMPALLAQHDWTQIPGRILNIEPRSRAEGGAGLWMSARFELRTELGRDYNYLIEPAPTPALNGLSVGFMPDWDAVEWRDGVLIFLRAHLAEVSVVTFPANTQCHIENSFAGLDLEDERALEHFMRHARQSGLEINTERDLELALRDAGRSRSDARRIASRVKPTITETQRDAGLKDDPSIATLKGLAAIFS
jgi:hypothetical protein